MHPKTSETPADRPQPKLGIVDAASMIVGIIIGTGFHQFSPMVAAYAGSPTVAILLWALGGAVALIGAACYAELATSFPSDGGDYTYLSRAFGRRTGFLFAWVSLLVVRPGNIGVMALAFAVYANKLFPLGAAVGRDFSELIWATSAVLTLTGINAIGLREGKRTQNLLSGAKVGGFALLIVAALVGTVWNPPPPLPTPVANATPGVDLGLAMIFVLFAYGGWSDVCYVAAEVRDPRRNIWRALLLGTAAVTTIYVFCTIGFFGTLGYAGVAGSDAVASATLERVIGPVGAALISVLICVACLGAINGMIFTGARVFYAAGQDHRVFGWLGAWDGRRGVPMRSLLLQSAITVALLAAFGHGTEGFERLVNFTTPPFWIFFTLTGISLFVFRRREKRLSAGGSASAGGYRVPFYPLTPLLFVGTSVCILWASLKYAWEHKAAEAWWTLGTIGVGVLVSAISGRRISQRFSEPRR